MKGVTVYHEGDKKFAIWQARLKDEMPHLDTEANPLLWWGKDLIANDYVVCGVKTKRECLEILRRE